MLYDSTKTAEIRLLEGLLGAIARDERFERRALFGAHTDTRVCMQSWTQAVADFEAEP